MSRLSSRRPTPRHHRLQPRQGQLAQPKRRWSQPAESKISLLGSLFHSSLGTQPPKGSSRSFKAVLTLCTGLRPARSRHNPRYHRNKQRRGLSRRRPKTVLNFRVLVEEETVPGGPGEEGYRCVFWSSRMKTAFPAS